MAHSDIADRDGTHGPKALLERLEPLFWDPHDLDRQLQVVEVLIDHLWPARRRAWRVCDDRHDAQGREVPVRLEKPQVGAIRFRCTVSDKGIYFTFARNHSKLIN